MQIQKSRKSSLQKFSVWSLVICFLFVSDVDFDRIVSGGETKEIEAGTWYAAESRNCNQRMDQCADHYPDLDCCSINLHASLSSLGSSCHISCAINLIEAAAHVTP